MKGLFLRGMMAGMLALMAGQSAFAQNQAGYTNYLPNVAGHLLGMTGLLPEKEVPIDILDVDVPESVKVGQTAVFTALANVETASLPIESIWNLGDGVTKKGLAITHQFEKPGTYTVSITVRNQHGSARRTRQVLVVAQAGDSSPGVPVENR